MAGSNATAAPRHADFAPVALPLLRRLQLGRQCGRFRQPDGTIEAPDVQYAGERYAGDAEDGEKAELVLPAGDNDQEITPSIAHIARTMTPTGLCRVHPPTFVEFWSLVAICNALAISNVELFREYGDKKRTFNEITRYRDSDGAWLPPTERLRGRRPATTPFIARAARVSAAVRADIDGDRPWPRARLLPFQTAAKRFRRVGVAGFVPAIFRAADCRPHITRPTDSTGAEREASRAYLAALGVDGATPFETARRQAQTAAKASIAPRSLEAHWAVICRFRAAADRALASGHQPKRLDRVIDESGRPQIVAYCLPRREDDRAATADDLADVLIEIDAIAETIRPGFIAAADVIATARTMKEAGRAANDNVGDRQQKRIGPKLICELSAVYAEAEKKFYAAA